MIVWQTGGIWYIFLEIYAHFCNPNGHQRYDFQENLSMHVMLTFT